MQATPTHANRGERDKTLENVAEPRRGEDLLQFCGRAEPFELGRKRLGRDHESTLRQSGASDTTNPDARIGTIQRSASTLVQKSSGPFVSIVSVLADSSVLRKKSVQCRRRLLAVRTHSTPATANMPARWSVRANA